MNELSKTNDAKLLPIVAQLLGMVAIIQVSVLFFANHATPSSFLWIIFSGVLALILAFTCYNFSTKKPLMPRWLLILINCCTLIAYVVTINYFNDPRLYIGLVLAVCMFFIILVYN